MAPSSFEKAKWMRMVDRAAQRWNCWQKGDLWPRVIYKVLTYLFKNQPLRILRQCLDCTHVCSPWVGWWRTVLRLQIEEILLMGGDASALILALAPSAAPAFQWPWCGFGTPVLLILNTRGCGVCEYVTQQVQDRSSCLFAGTVPSLIFVLNTLPENPSVDWSWPKIAWLGEQSMGLLIRNLCFIFRSNLAAKEF